MKKKDIKRMHSLFILGGFILLFLLFLIVYYFEKNYGLKLWHGQAAVVAIGIAYVYMVRYIEKNVLDTKIAYHNYMTMFSRVRNIKELNNKEILQFLEKLYPKSRPYKSSIAYVYFENGIMYRANKNNKDKYKALCMENFAHQVERYRHSIERL